MFYVVALYTLAIYGFRNPDREAWVGKVDEGVWEMFTDEEAGVLYGAYDLSDAHKKFYVWAQTGFYYFLAAFVLTVICVPMYHSERLWVRLTLYFSLGLSWVLFWDWWIGGIALRFNSRGMYASG